MLWQKIFLTKRPKRESTEFLGYKMLYNCTYFLERFNVDAEVRQMFVEVRIYHHIIFIIGIHIYNGRWYNSMIIPLKILFIRLIIMLYMVEIVPP